MQNLNFSLINLWCTKNLVDSQYFLGRLFDISLKTPEYQLNYFTDPFDKKAEIVFVNTCAFISSGRDEASETVNKLLKAKKTVYLMWCAVQYYKKIISLTPPLIPLPQGTLSWISSIHLAHGMEREIKNHPSHTEWRGAGGEVTNLHYLSRGDLNKVNLKNIMEWYDSKSYGDFEFASSPRVYTNLEQKFEYLKIAEWCDNKCTFCIIPQIRGKQQSLPIEKILAEAKQMIENGIQEIILIAQDTTRYGTDLYGKPKLLKLLKKLDKLKGNFSYRLLYLYPDIVTLNQVKELKKLKKFIPYFDIPLQHISSLVLKRMGRFFPQPQKEQVKRSYFWWLRNAGDLRNDNFKWNAEIWDFENDSAYDEKYITTFLDQIKKIFPVRFIRTNLIIGFPGETKQDFEKLLKFVDETKFNNIALFEYHDEPLAASSKLPNKVDDHEIRTRFTKMRQLVNRQLLESEHARKWKEEIGYIMEIVNPTLNPSAPGHPLLNKFNSPCPLHGKWTRLPRVYTVGKNKLPSGNTMIALARKLRKKQTTAELLLREILRNKNVNNLKFRRQHSVGNYIADFYCPEKKLVIELDGSIHNTTEQKKRDQERDVIMKQHNINVIRFTNDDVFEKVEEVIQTIIDISNQSPLATEWRGVGGEVTLVVRPRLHAPEIDSYDEITMKQVIGTFEAKNELEIGDKIVYSV